MQGKHSLWVRVTLLYLVLVHAFPGVWALSMPQAFYHHFPGFGLVWVAIDGPYNEHLIRDVGGFFIALAALCLLTLIRPRWVAVRATAICLLMFNGPHLWYHLQHLHMLPPIERVALASTLSLTALLVLLLLWQRPVSDSELNSRSARMNHE